MSNIGTKKVFRKGDTLVSKGERGECAYILETGQVEILIEREGELVQIGTRGAGSLIGEMAMIDDQPRVATVRALENCEAMEITRDDFAHRLEDADPVLKMVMRVILTRYRDMLSRSIVTTDTKSGTGTVRAEVMESSDAAYAQAVDALKVSTELRKALENEELSLHYQPIVRTETGQIAGYEALMRWNHPQKGNIPPNIFIPVAEEIDLIIEMTRWAMAESATAIKLLQQAAPKSETPLFMSVNMSVRDISHPDFYNEAEKIIGSKAVLPGSIHLEVTEGVLIENPETARETLEKCHARGFGISLDDFGTGYSSLSYLHDFPIDTLKIDQSFIRVMLDQAKSMELVRSIIGLAKNLHMSVIAEGIETREQAAAVKAHGCEFWQGFLFAKPAPMAQALETLKNWQPLDIQ